MLDAQKNMSFGHNLRETLLRDIRSMLECCNAFVKEFQAAARADAPEYVVSILAKAGAQSRTYNRPAVPEIAAFEPDDGKLDDARRARDIVIRREATGELIHLDEFNAAYDPLHFVLMHPAQPLSKTACTKALNFTKA